MIMSVYTMPELYELWFVFKDAEDAAKILSDFALCDKKQAQELIREFEITHRTRQLDCNSRGKADRQRVHI